VCGAGYGQGAVGVGVTGLGIGRIASMDSTSPSKIRPARLSDVPELVEMMGAFNRGERVPWRPRQVVPALRRLLRSPALGRVLVAEAPGVGRNLAGYAIATFGYDLEFAGRDSFVTELYVRPRNRRAGDGRRLLDAVAERMRRGGAGAVHLAVWPANRGARRLYRAAGFLPAGRLLLSKRLS
jgi:ribosomal protein S18 acetylase RimI-like enzyme